MQVPSELWYPHTPFSREKPALPQPQVPVANHSGKDTRASRIAIQQLPKPSIQSEAALPGFSSQNVLIDSEESSSLLWGFDVGHQRYVAGTNRSVDRLVRCSKLMLVNSAHTAEHQENIRQILSHLVDKKLINKYSTKDSEQFHAIDSLDIIADFLIRLVSHTKAHLSKFENYTDSCPVHFALSVPAIWSPASSRVLEEAMECAIAYTGFGELSHGRIDNLYIVSEPEAAATYLMAQSNRISPGEVYCILDCGGGTCDASTYSASHNLPLRLNDEVVPPMGDNCGSSYLNVNFYNQVFSRLKSENYLDTFGEDRSTIVQYLLPQFENHDKRDLDIILEPRCRYRIPGLKPDREKGFDENFINLNKEDLDVIFKPLLHRVCDLLGKQLSASLLKGKEVKNVFLVGGFGSSPSLQSFIGNFLVKFVRDNSLKYQINLVVSDSTTCVISVAGGAVLRALDPQNGPSRLAQSSFGFQRSHIYDPEQFKGHRGAKTYIDKLDGQTYVCVIEYFIVKGQFIKSSHRYPPITFTYAFAEDYTDKYLCTSYLWVNDKAAKSKYCIESEENKDVEIIGTIETDMSFLKGRNDFNLVKPAKGKPYYVVEFDLVPLVEGRNLKYEARWPSGSNSHNQMRVSESQISIASAFRPGTA